MEDLHEPLLQPKSVAEQNEARHLSRTNGKQTGNNETLAEIQALDIRYTKLLQTMSQQGKMAWPLLLNLLATYSVNVISIAFVGHLGKQELAAAAIGSSFVGVMARTVLQGLCGALDTQASQAFGAGDHAALPVIFQRTVLFLWVHALPLTALLLAAPRVLMEKEGEEKLAEMALKYLVLLIPNVWLDCVGRPLNRILVAQRITAPQMVVSLVVLPLHVATNYFLIHYLQLGYLGAAVAASFATTYFIILTGVYVWGAGLGPRVWGTLSRNMLSGWRATARLAYPACLMRCAESVGFSLMTLLAGLLPDPDTSVAAISVAFNLYGILYMGFSAGCMVASTFVGNALGAGDALQAKTSALAAILTAPIIWVLVATALVEPHAQRALMLLFTDGKDPVLLDHLHKLLLIVAALELFDGAQAVMSGVITGAGKQRSGALTNLVAFYVFGIPAGLALGFWWGQGVEGLYLGMLLGPITQTAVYSVIILRTRWAVEARRTSAKVASAYSLPPPSCQHNQSTGGVASMPVSTSSGCANGQTHGHRSGDNNA